MKEYRLKPFFGTQGNDAMIALDKQRRAKVEKAAGKTFTDDEWFKYKVMTIPKPKNR